MDDVFTQTRKRWEMLFFAGLLALAQSEVEKIGEIEFFGYSGIDLAPIRAALPVHEGEALKFTEDVIIPVREKIKAAVESATGHPPTDIAPVCCDDKGQWMIYIGLAGKSSANFQYNPAPFGSVKLPADVVKLYQRAMDANMEAVRKGKAGEDDSKGYSLSEDPPYRAVQLEMRKYVVGHEAEIRRVLESSSDAEQRQAAADLLGYANQSKGQIDALVRAAGDPDSTVRNNAIRALAVLASSSPKVGAQIPAERFIAMLKSGSWTDRNKAGWLVSLLVAGRDRKLLDGLRTQALEPLKEMAAWRNPGHAAAYREILDALGAGPLTCSGGRCHSLTSWLCRPLIMLTADSEPRPGRERWTIFSHRLVTRGIVAPSVSAGIY